MIPVHKLTVDKYDHNLAMIGSLKGDFMCSM